MTDRIASVVLAAGNATRFGSPKLRAEWDGRPLLERALLAAPTGGPRLAVLGPKTRPLRALCVAHGFAVIVNPRPSRGLASSLTLALEHLPAAVEAALVLLGDEPLVAAPAVERILVAYRREARTVAAAHGGQRSHPILIPRSDWGLIPKSGDRAGAELDPVLVDCDDLGETLADVDTPDDLLDLAARAAGVPLARRFADLEALEEMLSVEAPFAVRSVDGKGVRTVAGDGDAGDELLLDVGTLEERALAHGRGVSVLARAGDAYVALVG